MRLENTPEEIFVSLLEVIYDEQMKMKRGRKKNGVERISRLLRPLKTPEGREDRLLESREMGE